MDIFRKHIVGLFCRILVLSLLTHIGYAQTISNVGTDFWIAFQPNSQTILADDLRIAISSEFPTSGTLYSKFPGVNQSFNITPGIVTTLSVPPEVTLLGGIENKGIRITSQEPISVYGLSFKSASTDAFMALPVDATGTDYTVVTHKAVAIGDLTRISVIATEDNTTVTIFNHWTGQTSTATLDQGEAYLSADPHVTNQDITGSRIQANKPVVVFTSNDCVNIPALSCQACDHIVELMFPYYAWGKSFITVPLAGRDNSGDVFRIVAADDGTVVSVNGLVMSTINAGEYYETMLTGYNAITTSNPAMVAQFAKGIGCSGNITGDPFMMLIPPYEQFLTHYTVTSLSEFYSNWVNIVAPDYALGTIYQDGMLIPESDFIHIGSTGYSGAQRSVTAGSHTFTSIHPFGVFVYGWNLANSYGYPGGCAMSPVVNCSSLTLAPDTSYGQLNVTNVCLTATVSDSLSAPVGSILVTFHLQGLGSLTGTAYSDSTGHAQYCYARTGSVPGTDSVYAEVSGITSNTVVVFWSVEEPCVNPVSGGIIGHDQNGCAGFTPSPLINLALPEGQLGTLEYQWQYSVTDSLSAFTDIPASNDSTYTPGALSQTTWYRRLARVNCKPGWTDAVVSNPVEMTVTDLLVVGVDVSATDTAVCSGSTVEFTADPLNGGDSPHFQWKINGVPAGVNTPWLAYPPQDGDRINCILTSSFACTENNPAYSDTITMEVTPVLPVSVTVTASANPVCLGDSVSLDALPENGGALPSFQWMVNGLPAGMDAPQYNFLPANGDSVSCFLTTSIPCPDTSGASASLVMEVRDVMESRDSLLCYGTSWFAGGEWHTEPGVYIDTLAIPAGCIRYVETHYSYKPEIPLDLGPDTNLCLGSILFNPSIAGASYLWQDSTTGLTYLAEQPGEYWVIVTDYGCQATDSVSIGECPELLLFPNAFTPNGDGLNDTFHPVGEAVSEYSMRIFNRWGEMIFETGMMAPGWDGTCKGKECPAGNYGYIVLYKTTYGGTFQVKGSVIVVR